MFPGAVTGPRHDAPKTMAFDGKIGIYPCVRVEAAPRNRRDRVAGTPVTKLVEVNREVYKKAKMPAMSRQHRLNIQQDNARPNCVNGDENFMIALSEGGLDMYPVNQPPNSPDTNFLDLGFFSSIRSLQGRTISLPTN
ncbi:unnamed protein product [Discosporangium mesarthrocarpum]